MEAWIQGSHQVSEHLKPLWPHSWKEIYLMTKYVHYPHSSYHFYPPNRSPCHPIPNIWNWFHDGWSYLWWNHLIILTWRYLFLQKLRIHTWLHKYFLYQNIFFEKKSTMLVYVHMLMTTHIMEGNVWVIKHLHMGHIPINNLETII